MRSVFLFLLLCFLQNLPAHSQEPPALTLAKRYHNGIDLQQYWVSEKLDGVRAYWNGQQLISRQGNIFHAPAWFTAQLPATPLDGELWLGRGQFEKTVAIVRKQRPINDEWRQLSYMIFDLPSSRATFTQRLQQLQQLLPAPPAPVQLIKHFKVSDQQQLQAKLAAVIAQGGEGLMLHRANAHYFAGRTQDLLKLKPSYDAEARVIAHRLGKGKYTGALGSLLVQIDNGKQFYIGSGFSDRQRNNPPAVGAIITFRYYGLSNKGIPKHASFLRVRSDSNL